MAHYFFHVTDRDDPEGMELRDDAAADTVAHTTFGELIRDDVFPLSGSLRVLDATGRQVTRLNFSREK